MSAELTGRCRCGDVTIAVHLSGAAQTHEPRACDCDFCRARDVAYLSDPAGRLTIRVAPRGGLDRQRQGSGQVECLSCLRCDALVAAVYTEGARTWGTANSRLLAHRERLGPDAVVSPAKLSAADKRRRWRQLWFADVRLIDDGAV